MAMEWFSQLEWWIWPVQDTSSGCVESHVSFVDFLVADLCMKQEIGTFDSRIEWDTMG